MQNRPLRIALLDSWSRDPAVGSGSTVAIAGLARALEARGHEVTWPDGLPGLASSAATPAAIRRLLFNLTLPLRLRPSAFDLIVGVDIDGVWLPRISPDRYAVCLKGVAADEARFERGVARARLLLLAALERRNARRAGRVIVPSRYSLDVAVRSYGLHPDRMRVVPEGIDLAFWAAASNESPSPDRRASRLPRPPIILNVARQYPRKNTGALLRALPSIARTISDVRLRIVGGGPELPHLRRLAETLGLEGRVDFLGPLPDRESVRREHRRAAVFCVPSLQEGFGIAFLEAMAGGLPVVALRAGAVPEVVPHEVAGLLVPPGRPARLAEALILLLRDPELRARLGRAGRTRAHRYDWSATAERFVEAALGP